MAPRNLKLWYRLKDAVRIGCGGICEYCGLRAGTQLHHRHYSTFGRERAADVMLVCDSCHEWLSGKRNAIVVRRGSLADCSDSGYGSSPVWRAHRI